MIVKKLRFKVFLVECLINFLGWLPKGVIAKVATVLRWLAFPFLRKEREKLFQNCEQVLALPRHSQFAKQFCRQVIQHQIESSLESLITTQKPPQQDPIEIHGLHELGATIRTLKAADRGLIVVTAHLGSWEFVAKYCSQAAGEEFVALAKPSKSETLTKFLERSRGRMNTRVLWTDSSTLLKDMLRTMNQGSILGLVSDQKPNGRKGPMVQFFGRPTAFVAGPAKLSIKTNAPILAVFCIREGPWRYRIVHRVIAEANHGESDETSLTQNFASEIERMIRLYPEQWVWNYKRWRFHST